jgi:hypothetical protein
MRIKSLRLCITSVVSSAVLLGAGWLWARLVTSSFQRQEGITLLSSTPRSSYYEFWSVSVPSKVTANLVLVVALLSLFLLWRRRDFFSLCGLLAYFVTLAVAWVFLFANLGFEAFD